MERSSGSGISRRRRERHGPGMRRRGARSVTAGLGCDSCTAGVGSEGARGCGRRRKGNGVGPAERGSLPNNC
jgi:hypothetical protein